MAEESGEEHEEEAYDDAGGEWKVESEVVALNQDIARQASDVGDAREELKSDPEHHDKKTGANQPFPQGLDFHRGIIRNLKQRY